MENTPGWKKCSNCKKEIGFQQVYYRCSVTTCNHERTGLQFCTVSCWSAHVPIYRHRDAWAVEETSPSKAQSLLNESALAKKPIESAEAKAVYVSPKVENRHVAPNPSDSALANDVLVVVSKLKAYIKAKSDMNTSADVMDCLSDILRQHCDDAIRRARADGRKTVMARDFE